MSVYQVIKCPKDNLALSNCAIISPNDFQNSKYAIMDNTFIFTLKRDSSVPSGSVGTSMIQRRWAYLSLNQQVTLQPYTPEDYNNGNCYLSSIEFEVSFLKKVVETNEVFDVQEMSTIFIQNFRDQVFSIGQIMVFEFHGINLHAKVLHLNVVDLQSLSNSSAGQSNPQIQNGILMDQTSIHFTKAPDNPIKLKGQKTRSASNNIIQPNFKFEDMGIGGLDTEFSAIFRRAFASRIFPPNLIEKLGIKHVRGILLHGPPGTGKTLMARQIGKMLNAKEPKVVNGPEILNKYVGQSEENIRKLFADAEKEYKEKGDESALHIIIFDELDAICKQRGSQSSGTGVGDSVVNQLLSKMDGVDQLNNILVIGMTNRLDMIDEALLRPGRLEVQVEINLPDEQGRFQIIQIHTSKMRNNDILGPDVDLHELAQLTKNFSGAEIEGLVKNASSYAFNRHVKVGSMAGVSEDVENMKVLRDDFLHAFEECKPAFGVSDNELQLLVQNNIIPFEYHVERILNDGSLFVEQVKTSQSTPLVSVLLHGPPGSGKSALAATIAMSSSFPFVKLISPETMVGMSESAKTAAINKVFVDSYKSPISVIVIDNIERLLDWVPIGPRFSNTVLQALMVLLKKRPPKNHRLLLISTCTHRGVLDQMSMLDCFDADLYVPNVVGSKQIHSVVKSLDHFDGEELSQLSSSLNDTQLEELPIGIKKLIMLAEMANQDNDNKVDKLVDLLRNINI